MFNFTKDFIMKKLTPIGLKIKSIKSWFGFDTFELSDSLRVARSSLHYWATFENYNIKPENLDRIQKLYEVAEFWNSRGLGPLKNYLHDRSRDYNDILFNMLAPPILDINMIKSHFETL